MRLSFGIVTDRLAECRDFYVRHFDFQVATDVEWYIHLRSQDGAYNLAFLAPHRSEVATEFHAPFTSGAYLGFETNDVERMLAALQAAGVALLSPLRDELWGERHFTVRDPAGCVVNVWRDMK